MGAKHEIPARKDVPGRDRWNLSRLFPSEQAWEEGLKRYESETPKIAGFKGSLSAGPEPFLSALVFNRDFGILEERLFYYADLRQTEDEGDNDSRGRYSRLMMAATAAQGAWAWFVPEIQALPEAFVASAMADPRFADFVVFLKKLLRFKPHILGEKEERLLALQAEANQTAQETFSVLTNVDMDFGTVETPEGPRPLSQSTLGSLLQHTDRDVRRRAYLQFYSAFEGHKNTVASLYAGSVKLDKYRAVVRGFPNARAQALFPDDVPVSVYDNLVGTINANLGVLHDYYSLRRRALKLDELRHYDVYVPLVPEAKAEHGYDEAVELITEALAPLGDEYVSTLRKGLTGGWVDRYENKGKRSGAFSAGSFSGEPYILLNYKDDVLRSVFTMAHEGGHSMHSWYSARSNPFPCYNYTIFEAEVASTFNEQLLFRYLYDRAESDSVRASLLANKVDDTLATLFRQTMFAEFEKRSHEMLEGGEPLTVESLRAEYRKLLVKYFGPEMKLEDLSDLEGLRIPHFYNAFYVYKYATGVSASIALSKRVLGGGKREVEDYFAFLRSGGSRFPIEALKVAGVDMSTPAPVKAACAEFAANVAELKKLLKV
jgi:oligoendopeptidase F